MGTRLNWHEQFLYPYTVKHPLFVPHYKVVVVVVVVVV